MTTLASIVINHQSLLLLYDLQNGNNNNAIDTHILHNHIHSIPAQSFASFLIRRIQVTVTHKMIIKFNKYNVDYTQDGFNYHT